MNYEGQGLSNQSFVRTQWCYWWAEGGSGLSDPIQNAHKESMPKTCVPDKGCYGNPSPFGHEISRESTESVWICAYVYRYAHSYRATVMSSLLFRPSLACWSFLVSRPTRAFWLFRSWFSPARARHNISQETTAFQRKHPARLKTGYVRSWH